MKIQITKTYKYILSFTTLKLIINNLLIIFDKFHGTITYFFLLKIFKKNPKIINKAQIEK